MGKVQELAAAYIKDIKPRTYLTVDDLIAFASELIVKAHDKFVDKILGEVNDIIKDLKEASIPLTYDDARKRVTDLSNRLEYLKGHLF